MRSTASGLSSTSTRCSGSSPVPATSAATRAVTGAAEAGDILLPDPEVTQVARAAALIARGIVAGPEAEPDVRWLLLEWQTLFAPA